MPRNETASETLRQLEAEIASAQDSVLARCIAWLKSYQPCLIICSFNGRSNKSNVDIRCVPVLVSLAALTLTYFTRQYIAAGRCLISATSTASLPRSPAARRLVAKSRLTPISLSPKPRLTMCRSFHSIMCGVHIIVLSVSASCPCLRVRLLWLLVHIKFCVYDSGADFHHN